VWNTTRAGNQIDVRGDRPAATSTRLPTTKELDVTRKPPTWIGATITGVVAGVAIAATASAHVHVEVDGEAVAGQPAQLVFEVPNERDDAATVTIEIQMPTEVDLSDVVPAEVEGWTITTTTREGTTVDGDVVDTIRWEAIGTGLIGEESVELPVAVGSLPAVESLTFPTIQIYDDGETVRWIEPAPAGEPEPEFPVPTLEITAASPDDTTAPTEPPPTASPASTATPATEAPATESTTPTTEIAVIATAPSDTAGAEATAVTAPPTTVETDDDDGSPVWPWVVGVIVVVVVVGGVAIAISRRNSSP
jgi:periplasmic copper chaperone A